jgi:hypothetical protein
MNGKPDAKEGATDTNKDSLPVGESASTALPIDAPKPIVPETRAKQDIRTDPTDNTSQKNVGKPHEPLLVRVVEDDELNSFEQKTVLFGKWGVGVAALSLLAASVAGFYVFQQFREMSAQTDLASRAARQARIDAAASGRDFAKQIGMLQAQINQQTDAVNLTERAWVTIFAGDFRYVPDRQKIERVESMIYFRNSGRTPAFNVHTWRCNKVLEKEPIVRNGPPKNSGCIENDSGIMGTNIPISFEMPDFNDVVPANSLPDSMFAKGRPHYYVWGEVTYMTLSKDKTHFTSFCMLNAGKTLGPCSKGNDAD